MRVKLVRQYINLRHAVMGRKSVDAYVACGLAILPDIVRGEFANEMAYRTWMDEGNRSRPAPDEVVFDGYILAHAVSGYRLTPANWILPNFNAAKQCVRMLIDQLGAVFEGHVHTIQMLGSVVCDAHRKAGAYTGRHHYLRGLDATFNEDEYTRKLAELRATPRPVQSAFAHGRKEVVE